MVDIPGCVSLQFATHPAGHPFALIFSERNRILHLRVEHDTEWDYLLPGIPPTGKRVELPHVVVMKFENGKVAHEHIWWDQASLLVQVGLLDQANLPVAGVEQARSCCASHKDTEISKRLLSRRTNTALGRRAKSRGGNRHGHTRKQTDREGRIRSLWSRRHSGRARASCRARDSSPSTRLSIHPYLSDYLLVFRKVPSLSSSKACLSCSCVFITMGPYHATGSLSGSPDTSRKRMPSSPA